MTLRTSATNGAEGCKTDLIRRVSACARGRAARSSGRPAGRSGASGSARSEPDTQALCFYRPRDEIHEPLGSGAAIRALSGTRTCAQAPGGARSRYIRAAPAGGLGAQPSGRSAPCTGEAFYVFTSQRGSQKVFDLPQFLGLLACHQGRRDAGRSRAGGTANAMDVVLGLAWKVGIMMWEIPSTSMPRATISVATSTRQRPSLRSRRVPSDV